MPLSKPEAATLESVRGNIDQMCLIMECVRTFLDETGRRDVPLNTAEVTRLTNECHRLIDELKGRFATKRDAIK